MEYLIEGRDPASVFRFFEEICAIPHPSYHEETIADYLVDFAKSRGLDYVRDELHNVLICKPATKGMENVAPILFQGHHDMVCEKNGDVEHDFLNDPLKLFLDGNLLGAVGTTLGGDDGIAVAMMLSILDGEIAAHPAVECLFTVSEEVGLNGAHGFDYSYIRARRMINMDSEELGVITAGCAGGVRSELTMTPVRVPFHEGMGIPMRVTVKGLMGGHSGCDIHTGRANANKLMGRLLSMPAVEGWTVNIVSLSGGSKDNAIPRECEAVIVVSHPECYKQILYMTEMIRGELVREDAGFSVSLEEVSNPNTMLSDEDSARAIAILSCAANGVLAMNKDEQGLVEYSRNLGVVRTDAETGEITFVFSSRSATESRLDASIAELDALAAITGCRTHHHSRYPGWRYAPASAVRDAYMEAYRDVTGEDARIEVIHAGLECGIIYSKLPDMDIISIGPAMYDIHSPMERLDLASVEVFWRTVVRVVEILSKN